MGVSRRLAPSGGRRDGTPEVERVVCPVKPKRERTRAGFHLAGRREGVDPVERQRNVPGERLEEDN